MKFNQFAIKSRFYVHGRLRLGETAYIEAEEGDFRISKAHQQKIAWEDGVMLYAQVEYCSVGGFDGWVLDGCLQREKVQMPGAGRRRK